MTINELVELVANRFTKYMDEMPHHFQKFTEWRTYFHETDDDIKEEIQKIIKKNSDWFVFEDVIVKGNDVVTYKEFKSMMYSKLEKENRY